jgi:pimeloyl-ACP methyl ester carboxylesterase
MRNSYMSVVIAMLILSNSNTIDAQSKNEVKNQKNMEIMKVHYNNLNVNGLKIFYREAGPKGAPIILLMHGYPTSSFMFRNLIPILSGKYHVIAPDMPGFGFSDAPASENYAYTFDNIANTMQGFIDKLVLKRFAIYIFDYGAPVGLRLVIKNPEKITGIITQNGNAYEQGLLDWSHGLVKAYWDHDTKENREAIRHFFSVEGTYFQYHEGVSDPSLVSPDGMFQDQQLMDRPGNIEKQLDLLLDYRNNLKLYPVFQKYFRDAKPPILAVWGNKDPYFSPPGAEGFKKDDPNTTVKFYDTGHFALETHCNEIGQDILDFMIALPQ